MPALLLVQGSQAEPDSLPAGLRVWLGGPAGPEPSQPVQRLQEHALVAQTGPQERLCCALHGKWEAAPSLPLALGARPGGRQTPGELIPALGKLAIVEGTESRSEVRGAEEGRPAGRPGVLSAGDNEVSGGPGRVLLSPHNYRPFPVLAETPGRTWSRAVTTLGEASLSRIKCSVKCQPLKSQGLFGTSWASAWTRGRSCEERVLSWCPWPVAPGPGAPAWPLSFPGRLWREQWLTVPRGTHPGWAVKAHTLLYRTGGLSPCVTLSSPCAPRPLSLTGPPSLPLFTVAEDSNFQFPSCTVRVRFMGATESGVLATLGLTGQWCLSGVD